MNRGRNLILGAAVGYRWPQIEPFVRSLRLTGCPAEVVLLTGQTDAETRRNLSRYSVRSLPVHPVASRLPAVWSRKRYNRRWLGWLHRAVKRLAASTEKAPSLRLVLTAFVAAAFHHPACSRYFYYFRYLYPRAKAYDLILTTDVRDVYFQADPFAAGWRPPSGQVFLEHEAVHGSEPGNDRWIDMGFGREGLALLRNRRIICSGLTLGTASGMLAYLAAMTRELGRRTDRLAGFDGVDQGVHNWLFWTGRLPGFSAVENFQGPILTLHGLPASFIQSNAIGQVIDRNGRVIPVLHQYDRHPELAARIKAHFSPSGT